MPENLQWMYKFSRYASDPSFRKGQTYFIQDRVRIVEGSEEGLRAAVRGKLMYAVRAIIAGSSEVLVDCDCPNFKEWARICKHVWATLHAAEDAGYLSDLRFVEKPTVRAAGNALASDPESAASNQEESRRRMELYRWKETFHTM